MNPPVTEKLGEATPRGQEKLMPPRFCHQDVHILDGLHFALEDVAARWVDVSRWGDEIRQAFQRTVLQRMLQEF